MKVYFKPPICWKNSKRGTTYFFKIYISLTSRGLTDWPGRSGHDLLFENITDIPKSHRLTWKVRAQLTFWIHHWHPEVSPIDLEGQGTTYFLNISQTSRETYRLTWKVRETCEGHPIDLEGHPDITELLTFYILSRPFVVKTARRARLTFSNFIYHWHPERHPERPAKL